MQKNLITVLGLFCSVSLWSKATPDFVQVSSTFSTQTIGTNTSRYFLKRIHLNYSGANEQYVFSLQNTGSRVARISAIGGVSRNPLSAEYFNVHLYKYANVSAMNYNTINNSTLQISTDGTFMSGSDEVYTLQAIGDVGRVRGFEYIPKALYSVVVAPDETLTVTLDADGTAAYEIIIMWEEIVN